LPEADQERVAHLMTAPAFPTTRTDIADQVLAHIRGRTRMGKFACRPHYPTREQHERALCDLQGQGHNIYWVHGQVLDEPTVTGGWVIDE
jgi:hypothetical protein